VAEEEIVILDGSEDDEERSGEERSDPSEEIEEDFEDLESDEDIDELDEESLLEDHPETDAVDEGEKQAGATQPKKENRQKTLLYIIGSALLLLIITVTILSLPEEEEIDTTEDINETSIIKDIKDKEELSRFDKSKLEHLLEKANMLYEQGNEQEALKVFQDIATFNQALSHYNIGVAQMKEKKYDLALDSFRKALKAKEQKCISAINSAVCALHLGNEKLFKYYIYLAGIYLPEESTSPLYSYYYSLVQYLRGHYGEALVSLKNRTSKFYEPEQDLMAAKIYTAIDNNHKAIAYLEDRGTLSDDLSLGLLYARVGSYDLSISRLTKSMTNNVEPLKSIMALSLVYNKQGDLSNAAAKLSQALKEYKEDALKTFPIRTQLKGSLYDSKLKQKEFDQQLFMSDKNINGLLFYYAPYKVFDAKQTMDFIRKGEMNVLIDQTADAQNILKTSSSIAKVNLELTKGISLALENQIFKANKVFQSLTELYPNHSILFYNLGLSYAQLGLYHKAYRSFLRSYNLDSTNYLAGILALTSAEAFEQSDKKVLTTIKQDLNHDADQESINTKLSRTLLSIKENDGAILQKWIESKKPNKPLYVAIDAISAYKIGKKRLFLDKIERLQSIFPNDATTNILYAYAKNMDKDIKHFAKDIQSIFLNKNIDFNSLFYGSILTKQLYTNSMQIAGMLHHAKKRLKERLKIELKDPMGVIQALAFIDIYVKDYEESYTLYNELIDKYGFRDSQTLFLAAVAAIGANHKENAIALLKLAKLDDPTNYESAYALGLLYQEVKNYEGAAIQYKKVKRKDFRSDYFTFDIAKE
jgi:tetratricopeptide (TPR) repeat protein